MDTDIRMEARNVNFYYGEKFAVVIQGFDLDGDGKVDSIEVLE